MTAQTGVQAPAGVELDGDSRVMAPSIRAATIAEVVGAHADDVDREARFPAEAVEALREQRLLSALIPTDLGGDGASFADIAKCVEILGQQCASTAMIYAMHQIQVACLVRHGRNPMLRAFLREIANSQLLLASATTEAGIGGDVRSSGCHVVRDGDNFSLEKNAPVISYGAYADAILATARRTADSPPNDQVLVVCRRDGLNLEPTSEWNTLGFRGTCSPGFMLRATGPAANILDDPYGDISAQTMLPVSHTLWGSVWLGIANAAANKARHYVQAAARKKPGTTPPGAMRLADLVTVQQQFSELVHGAARKIDDAGADREALGSLSFAIGMNSVKLSASALVVDIVGRALLICGIAGYREDTPFRMGRLLRDAHGGAVMVNNDRIIANNAQLLLVSKE